MTKMVVFFQRANVDIKELREAFLSRFNGVLSLPKCKESNLVDAGSRIPPSLRLTVVA